MRQYNRLHIAVVSQHNKTPNIPSFFTLLNAAYPTMKKPSPISTAEYASASKSFTTPQFLENEPFVVVYDAVYSEPFCVHFDVYWAVASLHVIRGFIENLSRFTTRCDLLCIQYPDELNRPFTDAISPLFDSQEISISRVPLSYFLHLMDTSMYCVAKIRNRYYGYADVTLKEFMQLDLSEQVVYVRYRGEEDAPGIVKVVKDVIEVCELVEGLIKQLR